MKNKQPIRTLYILLVTLLLVAALLFLGVYLGLIPTNTYEDVTLLTEVFTLPSASFSLDDAVEREKAFTIEYPSDGEFTILWGTDFHLRRGPFGGRDNVYALLEKAFVETEPDLTIITGDLLFSLNGAQMLKEFALFMEESKRFWAFAFGNHDGQYHHDRITLGDMLAEYPHALFSRGEAWVLGESDYTIALTHQDEVVQALVMLDSHDHRIYDDGKGPDYIYPSQIAWYEWVAQGLGETPLFTFFHIPLPEYALLWESGEATGVMNDRFVNAPWENSGLFQTMVEGGTTVATFCGHDHLNDFHGLWEGIALHTGRSASFGSYGSRAHAKGVKTITLTRNNPTQFAVRTYTVDEWGL
ncbi:MAG TPA: metallophosphoesterase [Sphaerochaeta sp.]|nr:metallophosphoesterase [Sphaerochaeta sp.]